MQTVTSADGTTIAYERQGSGPRLILVAGALCDRAALGPLADVLAEDFDVVTYDRRGRGDSGDSTPYAVEREVDDIGALLTAVGGTAAVYGHSSGAGLVAIAAGTGLPLDLLGRIVQPTLVVAGTASPPFMVDAAHRIVKELQAASLSELADQDHVVPPEILAPVVRQFLSPR